MTLIAFHTTADGATIMTDSMVAPHVSSYPIGNITKVKMFNHLETAVICQGGVTVDRHWIDKIGARDDLKDFDELTELATEFLPEMYRQLQHDVDAHNAMAGGPGARLAPAVIFHVGYSPSRGRYLALSFSSDEGFAATEINTMHVMPSPIDYRPSPIEERRLRRVHRAHFDDEGMVDTFTSKPMAIAPTSLEGWRELAVTVREQRSHANVLTGFKTMIGGSVTLTQMQRGVVAQTVVHRFDEDGDEFAHMLEGTLHPLGQVAACPCGSEDRFIDCCIGVAASDRCVCGSGNDFAECCMAQAEVATSA